MIILFPSFFVTFISFVVCVSDEKSTIVYLPTEADETLSTVLGRKNALRYGFHQISHCKSFAKSFLCIQKCVDLNYDVAHADKKCKCTCYIKKDREKYKQVSLATRTRWRSGAPETSVPPWANVQKEKKGVTEISESSNEGVKAEGVNGTGSTNIDEKLTHNVVTDINSNVTGITGSDKNATQIVLSTNDGTKVTGITSGPQTETSSATIAVTT